MTKTILEEYLPYSSLARTDELVSENSELMQKIYILKKKLAIATKALKEAHKFPSTTTLKKWCEEALKEMEGVK